MENDDDQLPEEPLGVDEIDGDGKNSFDGQDDLEDLLNRGKPRLAVFHLCTIFVDKYFL